MTIKTTAEGKTRWYHSGDRVRWTYNGHALTGAVQLIQPGGLLCIHDDQFGQPWMVQASQCRPTVLA